jgi:hypothetical protein
MLTDSYPGNTTQSIGLAQALHWPYEVKALRFTPLINLHNGLFGLFGASRLGLDRARSASLLPPWPDVVIATGWRTLHVALWLRKQSQGQTRLVQLGRGGSHVAALLDAAISCVYFRLPPHPRRLEIVAPLCQITPARLAQAAACWHALFEKVAAPRIGLLVGGTSGLYRLDADTAQRLGAEVLAWAQAAGGTVFATTSRRTGASATAALRRGLGASSYIHQWAPEQQENPYLGYLALADVLVVTGDSESMLAEATATGKPVYIYTLPARPRNLRTRLREWVVVQSQKPPWNAPGTWWPQQGLAGLCARLIERGIVLPPNDVQRLHQTLVQQGMARVFGAPLDTTPTTRRWDIDAVGRQVHRLVGINDGQDGGGKG